MLSIQADYEEVKRSFFCNETLENPRPEPFSSRLLLEVV